MTREDLRNLTAQLVVVYTALEEGSRSMGDDPVFRHFHDPALERLDTLRADLAALTQPGESEVAVHPATEAYAARIREIGAPGISFYRFTTIEKVKPYKDRYRTALDEAPMSEADHDVAVAEAVRAFEYNQAVFAALDDLGR